MRDFDKWLEAVATSTTLPPPPVDTHDDDDDDSEWSWDKIHQRFGKRIHDWVETSLCAKKIKRILAEMVFKTEVITDGISPYSYDGESPTQSGTVECRLRWVLEYEAFEDKLLNTLRNAKSCDVWRAFGIKPEETWGLLDKGDVFIYLLLAITNSLTGNTLMKLGFPSKIFPFDADDVKGISGLNDKNLTLQKYAKFVAHDKMAEYTEEVKETMLDYYNMDQKVRASEVEMSNANQRVMAQLYGQALLAEIVFTWDYEIR